MRIAYAWDRLLPTTQTDAEQAIATIAALARRGADVVIVLPRQRGASGATADELRAYYQVRGDFSVEQLSTRMASFMPWRKFVHALRVVRVPTLAKADVVYTRNAGTFVTAARHGLPVVYDTHRAWPDHLPFLRPFFRDAMRRRNFVGAVFHSDYARRSYVSLVGDQQKLIVARNGYDPERYRENRSRAEARNELNLPLARPIAVYTGHVTAFKGIQTVMAMAGRCPDVLFLIVGRTSGNSVDRMVRDHANVRLLPWQPYDRNVLYQWAADVLLLPPSRVPLTLAGHTVLPLKVYGYLAAGRPILGGRTADVTEVLTHDKNAWLVEPGDVDGAVAGLLRLMADDGLRARLGDEAKTTAARLTWDARAATIETFIEERLAADPNPIGRTNKSTGTT